MSEGNDGEWQQPFEVWDPSAGQNVFTGQGGTGSYVQSHPDNYQGYSGAIEYGNSAYGNNIAIHPESFGVDTGTQSNTPQPLRDYRTDYEQMSLNPYDQNSTAQQGYDKFRGELLQGVQVAPGVRPNFGFMPGYGGFDMNNYQPLSWSNMDNARIYNDRWGADPVEQRILQQASDRRMNTPRMMDLINQGSNPGQAPNFGRGFNYRGAASPEEQAAQDAFMAGKPFDPRFFQARSNRIQANQMTGTQKIVGQTAPIVATTLASMVPVAGPFLGAGVGAMIAGNQSNWHNPLAIGLGAAGGLAGGWGGGALGAAGGLGSVGSGVLAGAGAAAGSGAGRALGGGGFDPKEFARNVAISGITGGVGGALSPGRIDPTTGMTIPGSVGPLNFTGGFPGEAISKMGGTLAGQTAGQLIPGGPKPQKPPVRQLTPAQMAAERRRRQQMNPYSR